MEICEGLRSKGALVIAIKQAFIDDFPQWNTSPPSADEIAQRLGELGQTVHRYVVTRDEDESMGFLYGGNQPGRDGANWMYLKLVPDGSQQ